MLFLPTAVTYKNIFLTPLRVFRMIPTVNRDLFKQQERVGVVLMEAQFILYEVGTKLLSNLDKLQSSKIYVKRGERAWNEYL